MSEQPSSAPTPATRPRRRMRTFAITGIAAAAVATGGVIAVNSASAEAGPPSPVFAPAASGSTSTSGTTGTQPSGRPTPPSGLPTPPDPQKARSPHLAGTVTKVSGTTILIKDMDGFTRTIVTSSTTKYNDSLTASPAVGTAIVAAGKVDANGTSLDATEISKPGPGGPGGSPGRPGPGGGHGWGPGGPGGPGKGPGQAPGAGSGSSGSSGSSGPSGSSGASSSGSSPSSATTSSGSPTTA